MIMRIMVMKIKLWIICKTSQWKCINALRSRLHVLYVKYISLFSFDLFFLSESSLDVLTYLMNKYNTICVSILNILLVFIVTLQVVIIQACWPVTWWWWLDLWFFHLHPSGYIPPVFYPSHWSSTVSQFYLKINSYTQSSFNIPFVGNKTW